MHLSRKSLIISFAFIAQKFRRLRARLHPTPIQENNVDLLRTDMKLRYFEAPDLQNVSKNGWRFINAVSDFATHAKPLRKTASYSENMFEKTINGNPLIDKAYEILYSLA